MVDSSLSFVSGRDVIQVGERMRPHLAGLVFYSWVADFHLPESRIETHYSKCSKISSTRCLLIRPRQTRQTRIRLLLRKQSDQGLPCLPF